jgi:16S rRNA (cytosine967-C5)-methyltransferase
LIKTRTPEHQITTADARTEHFGGAKFDRVLIDAPCTGIGALRRRPDARWRRSEGDLKALIKLQREILDAASEIIAEDGLILYVTCSPHLMETKAQVKDFLARHREFSLETINAEMLPLGAKSHILAAIDTDGCLQLLTARDGTDAMFMAMLQRKS